MKKIKVLFFAKARELSQVSEMEFEMTDDARFIDLKNEILIKIPKLTEIWQCVMFARNQEYENDNEVIIKDGDEVAIIPPISGG